MPGELGQRSERPPRGPRALLAFLFALWFTFPVAAPASQDGVESGLVIHVSDGDTIVVDLDGQIETVRLIGVDTPELGRQDRPAQPMALEAARFARRMVGKKTVLLRPEPDRPDRDRYGRLLRYVLLQDGICLNAEIIKRGYGRALLRYPFFRAKEFAVFERQARAARLGIWAGNKTASE